MKHLIPGVLLILACSISVGSTYAADTTVTTMQSVTYQQWLEQRKAYTGRILVVDMWATWCSSCIERFPKMVSMHNKYANQGVQIVSMNLDDRGDAASLTAANRFLQRINARFPNYHMDENLMQAFEMLDLIGIPVVLIYDRKGKQRYRLTGDNPYNQFTDKDIEIAIQHLINE